MPLTQNTLDCIKFNKFDPDILGPGIRYGVYLECIALILISFLNLESLDDEFNALLVVSNTIGIFASTTLSRAVLLIAALLISVAHLFVRPAIARSLPPRILLIVAAIIAFALAVRIELYFHNQKDER
ncbi:hypothetical protein HDV00_012604 [Rhizophlyctis rosea]|nr:hypothetical protein HDV00_012604 [Rhizophlyctis rosea]